MLQLIHNVVEIIGGVIYLVAYKPCHLNPLLTEATLCRKNKIQPRGFDPCCFPLLPL